MANVLRPASIRVLMRRLRKNAPLKYPVRLVQRKNPRCNGDLVLGYAATRVRKGKPVRFTIVVDPRLPLGEKWEVIIHEWAHCLDRQTRHRQPRDCHDCRWGQHFSRAFKASMG